MPHTMGSSMTVDVSNTSVRMKLMSADTLPLLSAVKNAEPYMLNPHTRNATA